MKEIIGTVYICECCNKYKTAQIGLMKNHEQQCASMQRKKSKSDKQNEIYDCLDIKEINTKIAEFCKEYKIPFDTQSELFAIRKNQAGAYQCSLSLYVKGTFDINKFKLFRKIITIWHDNEERNKIAVKLNKDAEVKIANEQLTKLNQEISEKMSAVHNLVNFINTIEFEYLINEVKKG